MAHVINITPNDIVYEGYIPYKGVNWPVYSIVGYDTYDKINSVIGGSTDKVIVWILNNQPFPLPLLHGIVRDTVLKVNNWYGTHESTPFAETYEDSYGKTVIQYSYDRTSYYYGSTLQYMFTPNNQVQTFATLQYFDKTLQQISLRWSMNVGILLKYSVQGGYNYVVGQPTVYLGYDYNPALKNQIAIGPTLGETSGYAYWSPTFSRNITTQATSTPMIPGSPPGESDNPYEPVDPSEPDTIPPGTFDDESDPIPVPTIPTISAANTGFTRIYNPTLSQVQALARYLWTDTTVIQTIWNHLKQYFEDPMQAMIGFNLVPCAVPDGGTEEFALMYIGTGVYMTVAANQFVDVDCGTLELKRYYGSALDQSPYTKITCFLPYVGQVQLDTDEVMGTTLQIKYRIDIVSGSCVAMVLVDGNCLYQFSGHCAINIPFSSADFSSYVSAAISIAKLGIGAVSGGIGGALAAASQEATQETGNVTTRTVETVNTIRNPTTGRQITDSTRRFTETLTTPQKVESTRASYGGLSPANIANTVGQVMASKTIVQHSGAFSGNSGYLGVRRPYLIIERPNMCLPASYQTMNGYPSMITLKLSSCSGYTRVQQVQLTGLWATNPEQAEIMELLKMGVVF